MPDPMWRQIADDLRQKIEADELGANGLPLPSEGELRAMYDASRNTIRDAVKLLVAQGLIVTRPGRGTFVTKKIDPYVTALSTELMRPGGESAAYLSEVAALSRAPEVSRPQVEIQMPRELIARELAISDDTAVVSRHQRRFIDGTPWSMQTSFYPMRFVEKGATLLVQAEDIPLGAVAYIKDTLGVEQAGRRDRLAVRAPDQQETAFFGLPDDGRIAVFEMIQTGYDQSGNPIRVTVTTYPVDRNQFVMAIGKVPEAT